MSNGWRKKMVDINLHQAAEKDLMVSRRQSFVKSTYFISLVVLSVVLVAYGLTMLYKNNLASQRDEVVAQETAEINSISADKVNELNDFQNRLTGTVYNLENKKNPQEIFSLVESLVVKGSYINELTYDRMENTMEMEAVAGSFKLAANQILSLKKSDLFSDVQIIDSKRDDKNLAVFRLRAVFKDKNINKNNVKTDVVE